jgi:hypothetical protein
MDKEDDYYHLYYNSKVWKRDQDEGGELEEDDSDEELLEEKSPSAVAFVVSIGARSDISFACPNIDSTKKHDKLVGEWCIRISLVLVKPSFLLNIRAFILRQSSR